MKLILSGKQLELTEALKALVATELSFFREHSPGRQTSHSNTGVKTRT